MPHDESKKARKVAKNQSISPAQMIRCSPKRTQTKSNWDCQQNNPQICMLKLYAQICISKSI